jgi:hypothetical protein
MRISLSLALLFPALLASGLPVQGQQMDEEFASSVKQWTTPPEFISPLVDHLPKSGVVPSPKAVLGYEIGTPRS